MSSALRTSLARSVYCVLGIPIDAIDLKAVVREIEAAASNSSVFLVSTPNLNFLVCGLSDPDFRESLIDSDLCPPDGAPIIWIARILGLPITKRAAGSDLLDRLQVRSDEPRRLTVFLFGGAKGVAEKASAKINASSSHLTCVGTLDPGFCDVDEMSHDHIIEAINSSGADFLVVSLGARKGQLWLQRNHSRLTIPVRSHLGAAINFQAGIHKRAPKILRDCGFEWVWRIKEERYLWKRYWNDGSVLLGLLFTRIFPLAVANRWKGFKLLHQSQDLVIETSFRDRSALVQIRGSATENNVEKAIDCFQDILTNEKDIVLDLRDVHFIDARFFGLLLMLRKELKSRGAALTFVNLTRSVERMFRLNELEYLLALNATVS